MKFVKEVICSRKVRVFASSLLIQKKLALADEGSVALNVGRGIVVQEYVIWMSSFRDPCTRGKLAASKTPSVLKATERIL